MIKNFLPNILQKPESSRNNWALGFSLFFTTLILVGFSFYRGYLSFGGNGSNPQTQTANAVSAKDVPSPLNSSAKTIGEAFGEIGRQFDEFKESIADVLVPFVTGIEVYER